MLTGPDVQLDDTAEADSPIRLRRRLPDEVEMDITPMIDCTFLLLIFFILTFAPDAQTALALPESVFGQGVNPRQAVIVSLANAGEEAESTVYLADGKIEELRLPAEPTAQQERVTQAVEDGMAQGVADVLIKAERGVPYRDVARVAAAASLVEGISLHFGVMEARE